MSDWNDGAGVDRENRRDSGFVCDGGYSGAALLLFILQNTDDADINFLLWDIGMPLWLLLVITILLTVLLTIIVMWFLGRRKK